MGDGTKENPYNREDVLRLIKENGGTAKGLDLSGRTFKDGIDLRGLNLGGIILKEAILWDINLEDPERDEPTAGLEGTHLDGSSLMSAHLEGAHILGSHLEGADLFDAYLEGALLTEVHLEEACLHVAHLEGAKLRFAHLDGAYLAGVKLSSETNLENVSWGDYILGEERDRMFGIAHNTYRQLKMWYTNAGMYDIAAEFYYREKEAGRKALKLRSKLWYHRLALEASRLVFGYGERWWNILFWIAGFILLFALIYYAIGSVWDWSAFGNSLYFSAVSFTALGYGNWVQVTNNWIKGIGAFESLVGVSMMALLLVTFVRKWTR